MTGSQRSCFRLGLGLLALLVRAPPAAAADPSAHLRRIVAVGDLHGDYGAWRDVALAAHLIDARGRWAGGDTVFVQDGDMVDRGPDGLKIVDDIMRLQAEAKRFGGRVIAVVGNHEAMNITGDLRYVSAADFAAYATPASAHLRDQTFEANRAALLAFYRKRDPTLSDEAVRQAWYAVTPLGWLEHKSAWRPDGTVGRWVVANPAVVLLDGTLFVHGGISAAYAQTPIDAINAAVAKALKDHDTSDGAIINDQAGPLWYRGLAYRRDPAVPDDGHEPPASVQLTPSPAIEAELSAVLAAYGAQRMVIAHTPLLTGIAVEYGGRLARIDTGMSRVYGGPLTYLEIASGTLMPHTVPRSPAGARP